MTRKHLLPLFLALVMAAPAQAARPGNDLSLFLLLNGTPVNLGVLITAGTTINNSDTATPFTVTGGTVLRVVCDAAAFIRIATSAATASSSYTSAVFGEPMAVGVSKYFALRPTDTSIAVDTTGGAANCAVAVMN